MSNTYKLQYNNRTITYGANHYISYDAIDILMFYPIGTLYKSVNADFDPNVTFGGTWITTNFEGRTPVGFFDANSVNGGEETHTLTMSECPTHTHSFTRVVYATYGNDTQTGNWNNYRSNAGSYDKVANGKFTPNTNTDAATHNNIQTSLICKIWERIA